MWMRQGLLASVLAGGVLSGIPVTRQATMPPPQASLVPGRAIILGRVLEAETTAGVAKASVTLLGASLGEPPTIFADGTPAGSRRVVADENGRFVFRDLPAGSYRMTVTAPGFIPGIYGDTRVITIRRSLDLNRTLTLLDTDRPASVTIQLWRTGGIGGIVVDDLGEPIVGAPISVLARMSDWGGPVMQHTAQTTTDDRGMYHVDVVPGDYVVGLLAATSTVPAASLEAFDRAQSEGYPSVAEYLSKMSASAGVVPRAAGTRLGSLVVTSESTSSTARALPPPFVGPDGRLWFYPTTFHPSNPTAVGATLVSIRSGEEKGDINIQIRPIPVRRVSGRVLGPAGPVANLALQLIAPDPAVTRTSPATMIDTPESMTDANGEFTFIGIAPGTYTLRAVRSGISLPEPNILWAFETVAVGDEDVSELVVSLRPGARIAGRVVVEGTQEPPPAALSQILVTARPLPGSLAAFDNPSGGGRLDSMSRFFTRELIPGRYMMTVNAVPKGWVLKNVTVAGGQNIVDQPFELPPGGLENVTVTITNRISSVGGAVRGVTEKTRDTVVVAIFPADRSLWRVPGMASRRVQTAAVDRNGRYLFPTLPAGEYFVIAADWPAADFSDGNVLEKVQRHAMRFTLQDGETRVQDLQVVIIK